MSEQPQTFESTQAEAVKLLGRATFAISALMVILIAVGGGNVIVAAAGGLFF